MRDEEAKPVVLALSEPANERLIGRYQYRLNRIVYVFLRSLPQYVLAPKCIGNH